MIKTPKKKIQPFYQYHTRSTNNIHKFNRYDRFRTTNSPCRIWFQRREFVPILSGLPTLNCLGILAVSDRYHNFDARKKVANSLRLMDANRVRSIGINNKVSVWCITFSSSLIVTISSVLCLYHSQSHLVLINFLLWNVNLYLFNSIILFPPDFL